MSQDSNRFEIIWYCKSINWKSVSDTDTFDNDNDDEFKLKACYEKLSKQT